MPPHLSSKPTHAGELRRHAMIMTCARNAQTRQTYLHVRCCASCRIYLTTFGAKYDGVDIALRVFDEVPERNIGWRGLAQERINSKNYSYYMSGCGR